MQKSEVRMQKLRDAFCRAEGSNEDGRQFFGFLDEGAYSLFTYDATFEQQLQPEYGFV